MAEESGVLERSAEYTQRLEQVRGMSQETAEEKTKKREAARELRMNHLLDNAKLMTGAIEALTEDPAMDARRLADYLMKNFVIAQPGDVERYVEKLVENKNIVSKAKRQINKELGLDDKGAVDFFMALLKSEHDRDTNPGAGRIKGKVRFVMDRFPLAIALEVEDSDDFNRIDPRKNVGGFYTWLYYAPEDSDEAYYIPVVVCKGLSVYGTQNHEAGHAENNSVWESLYYRRKLINRGEVVFRDREVWGTETGSIRPSRQLKRVIEKYKEIKSISNRDKRQDAIDDLRSSADWQGILNWACGKAKDELLAEMRSKSGRIGWHLANLTRRDGLYNYFADLGVELDDPLNGTFWKDYVGMLKEQTKVALDLAQRYDEEYWVKRRELFRWVLMQVPMKKWEKTLTEAGFVEEMVLYRVIYSRAYSMSASIHKQEQKDQAVRELEEDNYGLRRTLKGLVGDQSDVCLLNGLTALGKAQVGLVDRYKRLRREVW